MMPRGWAFEFIPADDLNFVVMHTWIVDYVKMVCVSCEEGLGGSYGTEVPSDAASDSG